MTMALINPGSGAVRGAAGLSVTARNAERNMRALLADVGLEGLSFKRPTSKAARSCDEGRYEFVVSGVVCSDRGVKGTSATVLMPGLPLEGVRSKDLLRVPRLYVDGNSWWWEYAIGVLRDRFEPSEDELP
jgi:hypothetical protein